MENIIDLDNLSDDDLKYIMIYYIVSLIENNRNGNLEIKKID